MVDGGSERAGYAKHVWTLAVGAALVSSGFLVNYFIRQEECPIARMMHIVKVTPYHSRIAWDAPQPDKEKIARAWMEKYVRSALLKKQSSERSIKDIDQLRHAISTEKQLLPPSDFD